jgi:hypothetical protein
MDAFLAGRGYWVAWVVAFVASVQDDAGSGAWDKGWYVVALVAWPIAIRASSLQGPGSRWRSRLPLPARSRGALRRTAVRLRWSLAAAYVAAAAVGGQLRFGSAALTVGATVAAAAAAAYTASRVGQDPVENVGPPPPAPATTGPPARIPPDGNPYAS